MGRVHQGCFGGPIDRVCEPLRNPGVLDCVATAPYKGLCSQIKVGPRPVVCGNDADPASHFTHETSASNSPSSGTRSYPLTGTPVATLREALTLEARPRQVRVYAAPLCFCCLTFSKNLSVSSLSYHAPRSHFLRTGVCQGARLAA